MKIGDNAERIEDELIAFANKLFGDVITFDMSDSRVKESVEETRNRILDIFS
jgi:hypothetical protein